MNGVQWVLMWAWDILWVVLALIVLMVTFSQEAALAIARRFWAPGILRIAGLSLEVEGRDRVDWSLPHVFVLNHQSAGDIPVAFVALPVNLRFIAKRGMMWMPFIGQYMWATGMIFVDRARSERAVASIRRAGQRIRAGASIIAFPEGTRSRDGRIGPFKKGVFVVAIEAGVPIVPVAISGARQAWPADGITLRGGPVRVRVGAPIETRGYDYERRQALVDAVRSEVVRLHDALEATAPADAATSPSSALP